MSISPTSAHAVTSSCFCSESRNTDPSRLYDTTDLKTTHTDVSVSPATGLCIAHVHELMLRLVPLFMFSSLHHFVLAARRAVDVLWRPGRRSRLLRKVGWANALPWLAFKHYFISGLLYSLCSVSSFISQRNVGAVCKSLMYIMRLSAIQREFCNNKVQGPNNTTLWRITHVLIIFMLQLISTSLCSHLQVVVQNV